MSQAQGHRNLIKGLTARFMLALGLISLLALAGQLLVQRELERQSSDVLLVNLTARQRLLSQKISETALVIQTTQDTNELSSRADELERLLKSWEGAHISVRGQESALSGTDDSVATFLFDTLDHSYRVMRDEVLALLSETRQAVTTGTKSERVTLLVDEILKEEVRFLEALNTLVFTFGGGESARIGVMQKVGLALPIAIIIVVLIQGVFIFRPSVNRIKDAMTELEKFRLAVENTSDHITIANASGTIMLVNRAAELTTGYSAKELIGSAISGEGMWRGDVEPEFYMDMWETIRVKKEIFKGVAANRKKNGEQYYSAVSLVPILDDRGEAQFFVSLERDITTEVNVDRAKTEFVSLASHQLRTPLSAINWYAEMLLGGDAGPLGEEQRKYVEEMYKGNQRMVELVNALLNVSRIELGTFVIEPEPTNIVEIADSVIAELKPSIAKQGIVFERSVSPDIPIIPADPKLVRIVFQNLLSNAVKYTLKGGTVSLAISPVREQASRKDTDAALQGNILIRVSDTGVGIPLEAQNRIFSKLFRADNARELDSGGTGLGLYIVKAVLDHSGGRVWFESSPGKGTTFYATLPLSGMRAKTGQKELG